MKRKSLLFSLLLALMAPWAAVAQTTVTIGNVESTSTSYHVPYNSLYGYSFVEQLYSAEEILEAGGMAGTITTIRFYHKPSTTPASDLTNHIVVYMQNANKTSFSAASDYLPVTASDIVFDGNWTIPTTTGWVDIVLDTPFEYDGTSDLMVAVHETTSGYSSRYFQMTSTTDAVCTFYSDSYNPDPYNLASYSGTKTINANRGNIQLDIIASGASVCFKPTVAVSNIIHNEATLTLAGGSGTYNVQYKPASDTIWIDVATNTPNTTFTLNGLTPLSAYDVQVQSVCEDDATSDWRTTSFSTTAQADAVGDYWSDDFEGNDCGWELINGTCADAWVWGTATNNGGTHALYISDDGGASYHYSHNSIKVLATKLLNFTEGKFEFSYDWNCYGESNYDFLRVALVPASQTLTAGSDYGTITTTSLPTGWIALDGGKLNQVQTWQNKIVAVNVAAGNYYLVLAWRSDTSTQNQPPAAVDNVSISRINCAFDVTGLTANDTTTNSATLIWNANGASQWQVAYSASNSFENATEVMVEDSTYNMTGLQSSTIYFAKVRSYCGGEDFGSWSSVYSFPTKCATITDYPYTENFDSYTGVTSGTTNVLPLCWNHINGCSYSSYAGYPLIYNSSSLSHSGNNHLYLYSYYSSSYTYTPLYAILPEMEDLGGKQVTLWARAYNATSTFKVGVMSNPADASTFVEIAEQGFTSSNYSTYQEFIFDIPVDIQGNYIAIKMEAANSSSTYRGIRIDDIMIDFPPSCLKPKDLAVSDITPYTAKLAWHPGAEGQNQWQICLNNNEENLLLVEADSIYTLNDLNADTAYTVKIRAYCDETDQSYWSNEVSFATNPTCISPTNLAASDITTNGVTLTWFERGASNRWVVAYKKNIDTLAFTETNVRRNPTATLEGLDEYTQYMVKVRPECDSTAWSNAITFTTLENCPTPTAFAADHVSGHNALLSWEGNNESYIVSYRTASYLNGISETFGTTLPSGWENKSGLLNNVLNGTALSTTTQWLFGSNNGVFDNHARINIYGTTRYGWLITPTIDVDEGFVLSFDLALTAFSGTGAASGTCEDDRFVVLVTTDNEASWTILREWNNSDSEDVYNDIPTAGENVNIDFSDYAGQSVRIAFYGESTVTGNGDNNLHIDNVNIGVQVEAGDWMTETVTDTAILLTGLMSETLYEAKLQGVCSNESLSHETSSIFFTTLDACPTPTQLAVDSVNVHFAILSWTENGEATSWQICVNGNEQNLIDVEENPYRLENLAQDTTYIVKVRANCGDNDGDSEWSNTVTLHTLVSCEIPTELAATLTPGDGSVATLNWASDAESWVVAYKSATDSIFIQETVTDTTLMLTNLTPETTYIAMVKAICGGEDGESRWSPTVTFEPSNKITIGSGTATFNYLPFNNYYKYSLTQQIYTVAELGEAGIIESIDFYKPNTTAANRNLNIYMVSTNKNSFESTSDWISVTEEDLVFSGTVNFANNAWTTIQFDVDFIYDGTQNVAIIVDDNTGSYTSTTSFRSFTADATQAIYYHNDSNNYDPLGTPGTASSTTSSKNQIRILKTALGDCMKPMHLATTEVGPDFATFDWTENGASESWYVFYQEITPAIGEYESIEVFEHPYTLTGLNNETPYTVFVVPSCGVEDGNPNDALMSSIIQFSTLPGCPAPQDVEAIDITHYTANVTWTGYNDSYEVYYRMTPSLDEPIFSEGFEGGEMPQGWISEGDGEWIVNEGYGYNSIEAHSGTYNVKIGHTNRDNATFLITPMLDFSEQSELFLSFWFINYKWINDIDELYVYYRVNGGEWTELWNNTEDHQVWTNSGNIMLPNLSTNYQIGFKMVDKYGHGIGLDDIVIAPELIADWIPIYDATSPIELTDLTAGIDYEVKVMGLCNSISSLMSEVISFTTVVDNQKVFVTEGEWGTAANWMDDEIPTIEQDAELRANVTIPNDCVAVANTITQGDYTITIKDGGQLYSAANVTATVEKNIAGYGEGNGNWYLISMPQWSTTITPSGVTGLLPTELGNIDLYAYNGTEDSLEWRNHKVSPISSFTFGKGYLYANANDDTLRYTATMPKYYNNFLYVNGGSASSTLTYNTIAHVGTWNLVGNPLVHNGYIYLGTVENNSVTTLPTTYYKMNETGTELIASDEAVKPFEGVFLQASAAGQFAFVSSVQHDNAKSAGLNINVSQNSNLIDAALIRFGEGNSLQKFQLDPNHTKVYMTEGETDYAVLFTNSEDKMPVSFQAETEGTYTISYSAENASISYLHLIDNKTGEEVDLLANPSYTFETEAGVFTERFTIVYKVK